MTGSSIWLKNASISINLNITEYAWIYLKSPLKSPPPPPPLIPWLHARESVDEYTWKCFHNVLNMLGLWICLVILYVWQTFEDTSHSKWVWIWHGCIRKVFTKFWMCLNMAQYVSKCLNKMSWLCQDFQYVSSS